MTSRDDHGSVFSPPYFGESGRSTLDQILARATEFDTEIRESIDIHHLPSIAELKEIQQELELVVKTAEERTAKLNSDMGVFGVTEEEGRTMANDAAPMVMQGVTSTASKATVKHMSNKATTFSAVTSTADRDVFSSRDESSVISRTGRRQSVKLQDSSTETRRRRSERDHSEVKEERHDGTFIPTRATEKRASKKGRTTQIRKRNDANKADVGHTQAKPGTATGRRHRDPPEDYQRPKVVNQVPIHVFWNSLEPYFKPLTDADLKFLEDQEEDDVGPYLIPPLGRHYLQVWAEEDRALIPNFEQSDTDRTKQESHIGGQPEQILTDELLETDAISCGPLTERIVSALIKNNVGIPADYGRDVEVLRTTKLNTDLVSVEERLKRELAHLKLFDETDANWKTTEDDEICAELRALQRELREQVQINRARKRKLATIARDYIAYQEYNQILEELDRQVEQSFARRHRVKKAKRKKQSGPKTALSDNAVSALDRRRRFIDGIGKLFPPEKFSIPTKSIFEDI